MRGGLGCEGEFGEPHWPCRAAWRLGWGEQHLGVPHGTKRDPGLGLTGTRQGRVR